MTQYQLTLLPFVGMSGVTDLSVGRAKLRNLDINEHLILDHDLRKRVRALAGMYRERSRDTSKGVPIANIGIVSVGENDFRPLIDRELKVTRFSRHLQRLDRNSRQEVGDGKRTKRV